MQASAVSCERIFSSSKETDTKRRSRLSPQLMEVLQMLKQSYKRDGLNFTDDWVACEAELIASGSQSLTQVSSSQTATVHDLIMQDGVGGLLEVLLEQDDAIQSDISTSPPDGTFGATVTQAMADPVDDDFSFSPLF